MRGEESGTEEDLFCPCLHSTMSAPTHPRHCFGFASPLRQASTALIMRDQAPAQPPHIGV